MIIKIETVDNNANEGIIVEGWAIDQDGRAPQIESLTPGLPVPEIEHLKRVDVIINEENTSDKEDYGFRITYPPVYRGQIVRILCSTQCETESLDLDLGKSYDLAKTPQVIFNNKIKQVKEILFIPIRKIIKGFRFIQLCLSHGFIYAHNELLKRRYTGVRKQLIYEKWLVDEENKDLSFGGERDAALKIKPLVSIVVPVYNVDEEWLRKCIDSVLAQTYSNWELCIADDCSPSPHVRRILEEYKGRDDRIKVVYREKNGHISEATNSAIAIASGDYIAFMDNDDTLASNALYENISLINEEPQSDFIYSDEDKVDINDNRFDPFFKPDWNPKLLLGHNYITHFVVVKRTLLDEIGGLRSEMNGAQDYDFVLRATERAKCIGHIPKILYHWRTIEGSSATNPEAKLYAYTAGKRALEEALSRRGFEDFEVELGEKIGTYEIKYGQIKPQKVSIIVTELPKNGYGYYLELAQSVGDRVCEIVTIATKNPVEENLLANSVLLREIELSRDDDNPANSLAQEARGDYLLFVDGDYLPVGDGWVEAYLNETLDPEVDLIGGTLLGDERIISVGVSLGKDKNPYFPQRGLSKTDEEYYYRLTLAQNTFALPLVGLFISRVRFEKMGGLRFSGITGSIDLSLRMRSQGFGVIWTPKVCWIVDRFEKPDTILPSFYDNWSDAELVDPYINDFIYENAI